MLFVIDVGNTNTVLGVYKGTTLLKHWRIQTHHGRTSDEHGILLRELFHFAGLDPDAIDAAIISCVVPPMERALIGMVEDYFELAPMVVGQTVHPSMSVLYDNPREVGADRLVNAVAAWQRYQTSLVVVDFGTATTFDAITADGAYKGGAIAPGVTISSEALFHHASKLPRVEIAKPPSVIGQTTVHSIQSGLLYGYTGLVREIVTRMKSELDGETRVVATGGLARFIAGETDIIDEVDDFLTLEGLRLISEEQEKQNAEQND
jgi:type III pantothenate kinase